MLLSDFDFNLPTELIAKYPLKNRDEAKFLIVNPKCKDGDVEINDKNVFDLPSYLTNKDVIVFNDTKVIPVRLNGLKDQIKIEVTLFEQTESDKWQSFCKKTKKLNVGDKIIFANDFFATVIQKNGEDGTLLQFNYSDGDLINALFKYGIMPLPPYIKRDFEKADFDTYQTVYAKNFGAVACPTAGLHFTKNLLDKIKSIGTKIAWITLHVGAGTFLPVKENDISKHKMHKEFGIITKESADIINLSKQKGGRIFAIGTTALRLLESATDDNGIIQPFNNWTNIFITPGYKFKIVDVLMTNFHIPKSTLFMLVSAFAGIKNMKIAYKHAIENKYRFYSYGDSSLLFKYNNIS